MTVVRAMTRIEFATPCDLTYTSLQWAVNELAKQNNAAAELIVHPYAKHFAMHVAYHTGYKVPVAIDPSLAEDEWILQGATVEVHSEGA